MKLRNRREVPGAFRLIDRSTPSYSFEPDWAGVKIDRFHGWHKAATLIKTLGIDNAGNAFTDAFRQVTQGRGGELRNILTLHSSALFALLLFHSVGRHSLTIGAHTFDRVLFEVENAVNVAGVDCRDDNPSSVDVALYDSARRVLLLLEVKLTEPLDGNSEVLADKYLRWLRSLDLTAADAAAIGWQGQTLKARDAGGRLLYNGGIKQLIAHLIGAMNGPDERSGNADYRQLYASASTIYLATFVLSPESDLLHDGNGADAVKMANYAAHAERVGRILRKAETGRVRLHSPFVLTTSDLRFSRELPAGIRQLYSL